MADISNECEPQCHSLSLAYQTYLRHDEKEQNHWHDVCRTFRQYGSFAMAQLANHQSRLCSLPPSQQKVLPPGLRMNTPEFQLRASQFKEAAIRNQFCLDCILRHAGMPHSQQSHSDDMSAIVSDSQLSKTSSVLKSLARDWSIDGKPERDMAYEPLLNCLQHYVALPNMERKVPPPRICVPGAGKCYSCALLFNTTYQINYLLTRLLYRRRSSGL